MEFLNVLKSSEIKEDSECKGFQRHLPCVDDDVMDIEELSGTRVMRKVRTWARCVRVRLGGAGTKPLSCPQKLLGRSLC